VAGSIFVAIFVAGFFLNNSRFLLIYYVRTTWAHLGMGEIRQTGIFDQTN
jgi:hypothetical protein